MSEHEQHPILQIPDDATRDAYAFLSAWDAQDWPHCFEVYARWDRPEALAAFAGALAGIARALARNVAEREGIPVHQLLFELGKRRGAHWN